MCESSIYVKHRNATATESLQLLPIPGHPTMRGLYPQSGDKLLVCVKGECAAWLDKIEFASNIRDLMNKGALAFEGQTNVPVTLFHHGYSEGILLPGGLMISLAHLRIGTKVFIGVPMPQPISGDKGMEVVKQAIVEVEKTDEIAVVKRVVRSARARAASVVSRARSKVTRT